MAMVYRRLGASKRRTDRVTQTWVTARWLARVARESLRRAATAGLAPVLAVAQFLVPVTVTAGVTAAVTAGVVAGDAAPAQAAAGSVLILSTSVNGGSSSQEAQDVPSGYTVTVASPSAWDAMTASQFAAYSAIIIGDPSSGGTCASSVPADALNTAATWGAAVTGNVAVLGTAPALAGSQGSALISDAIGYAAAGNGTGLYVSLNCEYSTAGARTPVALLADVDGGGFTVRGQGPSCPDSGTVNTWAAENNSAFNSLASSQLASWPSPACSVQETFDAWPAQFSAVAYDSAAAPAEFTASDGTTGQGYVLVGAPVSGATQALAPAVGGELAPASMTGGSNPAAPGVTASMTSVADGVNAENGDFTQSLTDFSIPTFGPALDFTRSYDAQLAQQQTLTGTPGPMGYGWAGTWDTSLTQGSPVPADIYLMDGLATNTGEGGPPTGAALNSPGGVYRNNSNTYIVDTAGNRVEEIPATAGTQWGQAMNAGDIYTIAGSDTGGPGASGNGTPASGSLLNHPGGISIDGAGNLYIADTGNDRVLEIPAASGSQRGQAMTADDVYVIAGQTGQAGVGADGQPATSSDLNAPQAVTTGFGTQDLYIADTGNNRIQEIPAASGSQWGQPMTGNDVYTVAGSAAGTPGGSGDGGPAASALLDAPQGLNISSAGDLYIADTGNDRVQEVAATTGSQWAIAMTAFGIYTVAGRTGQADPGLDGKPATQSDLNQPTSVDCTNGQNLYIADNGDNRIQEVSRASDTEWGQPMTANDVYTIAGHQDGAAGYAGNGGLATSALLDQPEGIVVGGNFQTGNYTLFIADAANNEVRAVASTTADISDDAGGVGSFAQDGDGGPATTAGLLSPGGVASDAHGDIFVADSGSNRVQEIAAYTHTQFGIPMTAGDTYTVAGQQGGYSGAGGDGGPATSAYLALPTSVTADAAGNLYIADCGNNRIQEVSAASGTITTIAGSATGTAGNSGQGGPATSALLDLPFAVAVDSAGDVFIAGNQANQVYEVPAATGNGMTAGNIYTLAGSTAGTAGSTGGGGPATSALLDAPQGIAVDPAGNLYIADAGNNRIEEIAATSHPQWSRFFTAGDIYTIVGSASGAGNTGDGGPAQDALLSTPGQLALDSSGNLYLTDANNNRIRMIAAANGTQWGQIMTTGDIYNVAGSPSGASGGSGNGGPATSALLHSPEGISTDPSGDLFITDSLSNRLREVTATATPVFGDYPTPTGITITQPTGAQITFYHQSGGGCTAPYVKAGGFCTLPQNTATLTHNTDGTYTFTPTPGTAYTYTTTGTLTTITDAASNTLTVSDGVPAPGSGNCPTTAATCTTITAANARTLVIGYDSAGQLTSVTDPMNRQWAYTYSSAGDLTSAKDPMGNTTTYTYGTGSTGNPLLAHDLLTITRPNAQPRGADAGDTTSNAYNTAGQVSSQTDPMGYQTTFSYTGMNTSTGNGDTKTSDPDGNTTIYSYAQGALTAQSDWTGTTLTSEQNFGPSLTAASGGTLLDTWTADGNKNITTTTYDNNGNPVTTTAPDGVGSQTATTTQQFTGLNQPTCSSDATAASTCSQSAGPSPVAPGGVITPPPSIPPQGVTWTLYDTNGNELYTTTGVYPPSGGTASYTQTSYQLFKGNSITLGSNNISCTATPPSPSLPCATINPSQVVTQLAYNSAGDLTSTSTPDGNGSELATTTNAYNGDGEQTSTTSPDGNLTGANTGNYTTVTAYNNDGEQTSVTQAGGAGATATPRVTNYGYDPDGNQTTVQDARGYTTTTTYNADNLETLVSDPDGNATLTCYDGVGDIAQTVPPVGVAASGLTPASCPTAYPTGYSIRLAPDATVDTFDATGQKTQETTPAPTGESGYETTTYAYDGNGNLTQTTAPPTSGSGPNQVTVDTYNSAGELSAETTEYGTLAGSTISYCYDPNGDKTSVVAADGNISGVASCETSSPWVVNSSSYPAQAAHQTTYSYDSAGEPLTTTTPATAAAPSGATTTYTYDPTGNVLTRTDPNGVVATWTYRPSGRPATISYSGSTAHSITDSYDANGSKTAMTDATGTSSYHYDPFSELVSATNSAGQTIGYGYSADGKVTSITYPLPATATWASTSTVAYDYDHADQLTSVTDFNGHQIAISNTADGLPSSVTLGSTGDTITTSYDSVGKPSSITLKNGTSTLQSFTYTDSPAATILNETDTPSSAQSPATYTYDAKGRVISMTPGTGAVLSYSFDASGNLTTLPTGGTGTYDDAGELTSSTLSGTITSYTYNADGQRLAAMQGSTTIASGTWNGASQLTTYSDSTANMTTATYDGNGMRASLVITPAGQSPVAQDYVWNTTQRIPQMIMDSSNAYIYTTGDTPAEQVSLSNGMVTYLIHDQLGSVRGIVGSGGSLTASSSYDAWGNPETSNGLAGYTPFGYAGAYTDPTGLIYLIARYYEPQTGQFISVDPMLSQSQQSYGYGNGDPVINTDPRGLWWNDFGCGGFYVNYPHKFSCVATAANRNNGWFVVIREGFYRADTWPDGFGREKAHWKHNLWVQPIINIIAFTAMPDPQGKKQVYGMQHWTDGYPDLGVRVVSDTRDYWQATGEYTPDHRELGLQTAYCTWPDGEIRRLCPDWVNGTGVDGLGGPGPNWDFWSDW